MGRQVVISLCVTTISMPKAYLPSYFSFIGRKKSLFLLASLPLFGVATAPYPDHRCQLQKGWSKLSLVSLFEQYLEVLTVAWLFI